MARRPPTATFIGRCTIITEAAGASTRARVLGPSTADLFGTRVLPEWASVTRATRSSAVAAAKREAKALPCGKR